jgi:hypothetical protein
VAQLEPLVGPQHLPGLLHVRARVRVDLLARQHRAGHRAAARVAHARGVVADDQHDRVAGVLELPQLLEHDRVPEMQVGRGRVQAELGAQRAPGRQALLKSAGGQRFDRIARQVRRRPGGLRGRRFHPGQC